MKPAVSALKNVDWDQFNPDAYISHNYENMILPEDKEVIRQIIKRIHELDIQAHSMQRVLNVGHGAVFTTDAITQHLLANTGAYDLVEYGKQNIVRMQETITRGLAGHKGIWEKFEEFAATESLDFKDGLLRAWQLSRVVSGSIYDLPSNTYDASFTFYCPESITDDVVEFEKALHSFMNSVKKGGLIVIAFMRGSEGYATAGRPFPAVSIDCDDIHRLLSPGVKHLEVTSIIAPRGARPADGPQYTGIGLATGLRC